MQYLVLQADGRGIGRRHKINPGLPISFPFGKADDSCVQVGHVEVFPSQAADFQVGRVAVGNCNDVIDLGNAGLFQYEAARPVSDRCLNLLGIDVVRKTFQFFWIDIDDSNGPDRGQTPQQLPPSGPGSNDQNSGFDFRVGWFHKLEGGDSNPVVHQLYDASGSDMVGAFEVERVKRGRGRNPQNAGSGSVTDFF